MIYNAPSIYKQGGGGGGYKDGGALVDGDFIKVENNAVSTYYNETRNDINYYFEVKDGEVINAVIELTTDVNATVHVYIVQNELYIPLGNVGGDTVSAGEDYKVNITGDSFSIEQVSNLTTVPEYAKILNGMYQVAKIGDRLWLKENFAGLIIGVNYKVENNTTYYSNIATALKNFNENGWRVARQADVDDLGNRFTAAELKRTNTGYTTWDSGATGTAPVTFYPYGMFSPNFQGLGMWANMLYIKDDATKWWRGWGLTNVTSTIDGFNPYDGGGFYNIRLVKLLT